MSLNGKVPQEHNWQFGVQKKLEPAAQVAGITEIDTLITINNTGITIIKKQLQQARDELIKLTHITRSITTIIRNNRNITE